MVTAVVSKQGHGSYIWLILKRIIWKIVLTLKQGGLIVMYVNQEGGMRNM